MLSLTPGRLNFLVGFFCLPIAQAQSGIPVAAFGYRNPGKTIVAAPGQVMSVSVFGVAGRFPDPVFPIGTSTGLPTEVEGISANFVQGLVTVQLPIRGVQQSACPPSGTCLPATTLTIQIPYELDPMSGDRATLNIGENEATIAVVDINPAEDSVHIINTCDQTGIYLSIAFSVPPGACVPMVEHASGQLVSATLPATGGETLNLWAYGLGAIDHPDSTPCCASPGQLPLAIQPFTVKFSYTEPGLFRLRRLAQVAPTYVGMTGGGLYQVQFVVPPPPPSISRCSGGGGNLIILLSGPTSADSAEICLQ